MLNRTIIDLVNKKLLKWKDATLFTYGYFIYDEILNKVIINPEWSEPDFDKIKKIGITGSYGKTSTCEYLYSYLRAKEKKCLIICTNGIFVNDITIKKNIFQTSFRKKDLDDILKAICGLYEVEYIIIELAAEIFLDSTDYINFDVVGFTTFDENLINHFGSIDNYKACKNKTLQLGNIALVNKKYESIFYHTDTFDYIDDYKELNVFQLENISTAIAVLQHLNIYDSTFDFPLLVRGRFETFKDDKIIIDTGWCGMEQFLSFYKDKKLKLIFIPILAQNITQTVQHYRDLTRASFNNFEKVYFTIPKRYYTKNIDLSTELLYNEFLPKDFSKVELCWNHEEAFQKAYNELKEDETLLVICRENFREFRDFAKALSLQNIETSNDYKVGIELEFNCDNLDLLLKTFEESNIDFIWSDNLKTNNINDLVIKRERAVDGYEICFPPNYSQIQEVLAIMSQQCYFTHYCAIHVHVSNYSKITTENLETIYNYYKNNENNIIQEVIEQNLLLDRNTWLTRINNNVDKYNIRKQNLNVWNAYRTHRTVEHRVYGATFDYEKFMWCINHTLGIIKNALNDNNEMEN